MREGMGLYSEGDAWAARLMNGRQAVYESGVE